MADFLFSASILVHFALVFYTLGFLARDELWLRVLILIGTFFYLLYYFHIEDTPLWDAIFASGVLGVVNMAMIIVLTFERTTFAMDAKAAAAYQSFPTLNPGQFRRLMRIATDRQVDKDTELCREGAAISTLYLVPTGHVTIEKNGQISQQPAPIFIGEVGFLLDGTSSATVTVPSGTNFVEWRYGDVRQLMRKSTAIDNALVALFSRDLARKVGNSMPTQAA